MVTLYTDASIVWLDFVGDLVMDPTTVRLGSQMTDAELTAVASTGRLTLREKYRHDGTHLSPLYLELLEANLNRLPPAPVVATPAASTTAAKAVPSSSSSSSSGRK